VPSAVVKWDTSIEEADVIVDALHAMRLSLTFHAKSAAIKDANRFEAGRRLLRLEGIMRGLRIDLLDLEINDDGTVSPVGVPARAW